MKNIMPPINTPDNAFHDGNPATGEQGTIVPGLWLNNSQDATRNIQQELISVLTSAGIDIDESQNNQLLLAIQKLISDKTPAASLLTKGIVQLNSSTTSASETLAATPKAVKAVSDAAGKIVSDLSDIGIGLPSMTVIPNFDFQNFAFTSGANYLASSSDWINVPSGVSYPTGLYISITVDYATGTQIGLTIKPSTVSSTNFKIFDVRSGGYAGSRTFTVREVQTVDSSGFAGRLMGTPKIFNSSALYTPAAGCKLAIAEIVAAGGGGGGCYLADATGASAGGGGGSGGYSLLIITNPVATTITIGTGGAMGVVAANSSPAAGSAGGDTTFGSLATAKGGRGGLSAGWAVAVGTVDTACSNGGGGGVVGTGLITSAGDQGSLGIQLKLNGTGGIGGSSKLGSGGHYVGTGYTITLPTKGGGGVGNYRAAGTTYAGSNGADGYCVVWEYF
ncbi:phage tail protein [Yersinia sp. 1252 StPb PI]|uniref:phage tail protein n=1 Tax=Yersinia sp. 1252 StPb PI TaxID=3117404 RepID=UPI003B28BABF